jgi:hypothetical protein
MSEQDKPRPWGGKRTGAGRKPAGEAPMQRYAVWLEPHEWAFVKDQGDGSKSRGIRAIVQRAMAAARRRKK